MSINFLAKRIKKRKDGEEQMVILRRKNSQAPRGPVIRVDSAALEIVVTNAPDPDTQKRILERDQQITTKMRTIFKSKENGGTTMKSLKNWLRVGCMAIPAIALTIVTGYILVKGGVWPGVISCIVSTLCLTGPIAGWFGFEIWKRNSTGPQVDEPPEEKG